MSTLAVVRPADQNRDDLDLVAAVRAGDERAFEQLYARYQGRITTYVRGMVHDHGRAEDITQDVFMAALRRLRETEREILFRPWIYEIAKNACIDAFRRSRNTHEVSLDATDALGPADHGRLADTGPAPDKVIDSKLAIDNLCGALGGLSQAHHDILVMREFEGLTYREIGERLGMSAAAVESTLFRARRRLGEEYEELVSGKRCVRVREIVDRRAGRVAGIRDRRRLARHISHCQPCRRYALAEGVDLVALRDGASKAARIAALVPLPSFLRRRPQAEDAGGLLTQHAPALNVVSTVDPSLVAGWSKTAVAAVTVVVAGLGAGSAVKHESIRDFVSRTPGIVGLAPDRPADALTGSEARPATSSSARTPLWRPAPGTGAAAERAPKPAGAGVDPAPDRRARSPQDAGGSSPGVPAGTPAPAADGGGLGGVSGALPAATPPVVDALPEPRPRPGLPLGGSLLDGPGERPDAGATPSAPSLPSAPSRPAVPALPSVPSRPAVSSAPALPSVPAVPALPGTGGTAPGVPAPGGGTGAGASGAAATGAVPASGAAG